MRFATQIGKGGRRHGKITDCTKYSQEEGGGTDGKAGQGMVHWDGESVYKPILLLSILSFQIHIWLPHSFSPAPTLPSALDPCDALQNSGKWPDLDWAGQNGARPLVEYPE